MKKTILALNNLDGQGSKQISANLVEFCQNRKDLDAAVTAADLEGDFPETIRIEVEDILEAAPALEIKAAVRQDELEAQENNKGWICSKAHGYVSVFSQEGQKTSIFS